MANREEHANGSMQVYNSSDAANASIGNKKKRRMSHVWNHFTKLTVDGELKAECNYCHDLLVAQSTAGTSHLNRHIQSCPKRPGANQEQHRDLSLESDLSVLMKQKNVEQDISPEEIARMMISHGQSFSILEQNNYWQFLTHLNPMLKAISHTTIVEKLLAIFEEEKLKLLEIFSRSCSRVSLSANLIDCYSFKGLCLKAHFIDQDWKIHRKTIKLDLQATFDEFTNIINGTIKDWNLDKKLFAMTKDWYGINHIEYFLSDLDMDLTESISSPTKEKLWVLPCMVKRLNSHLHIIAIISCSFSRCFCEQNFLEFVSQTEIKHPHFANRELHEHYCILKSALLFMEKFPDHKFISPLGDELSDEVLKIAERFCSLVFIVSDAMKVLSEHDNSTSNLYFHSFCKVRKALEEAAYNADYMGIFQNMQRRLDMHFRQSYVGLSIPVILDPRFKFNLITDYFQEVFGSDAPEYNSKVKEKFNELFVDYSSHVGKQNGSLEIVLESNDALHNSQARNEMITSELDRYLRDEHIIPREGAFDILQWWRNHSREGQYPILACMAKDILAIPATSAVFFDENHKRGVAGLLMRKLRKDTIDAIVCTQDWLKLTVGEHEQLERSTKYADNRIEICKKLSSVTVDGNELVSKAQIQKLCKMIASHGVAFLVLQHDDSWEFFTRLNPIFNMISRATMEQNFLAVFEQEKIKLKELFNRSCGRVFLSAKIFGFEEYGVLPGRHIMSLRAHFIDQEWQIHRRIVKYCLLQPYCRSHNDIQLCHLICSRYYCSDYVEFVCNIVREVITDWNFGEKISGLIIEKHFPYLTSIIGANRCPTKGMLPTICCAAKLINDIMNSYTANDTSICKIYRDECLEDSLWHSQKYLQIISQLDLHPPPDESLFWYKVYYTLEVGLRLATISPAEKSKAAERFCKIARTFYNALKVVAVSDNLTSNLYFHAFWSIRTCLQQAKSDTEPKEFDGIVDVIERMSNSLEEYWQESYLWLSIPVVLDPRYKIRSIEECFEQAFGSDAFKYISQVKRKLHELLISYFDVDEQCNGSSNSDLETPHHCDQYVSTHMEKQVIMELDRYYGDSLILRNGDFEILQWWKDNTWVYPTVACVAQDILAMSLSTVNFEEAFYDDCSRTYSTKDISFKSKLNAKTMEAFECMQDWTKSTEPIPTSSPGDADNDHALASQRKRKETSETQKSKSKAKRAANFPTHHSSSMGQTDMTASTPTPKIVPPLLSSLPLHDWVGASTSSPPLLSSQRNISKLTIADSQSEAKSSQSPSASKPHSTPSPSALPRIPAEDIFVLDFDSLGEGSSFKSILGRLGFLLDNYGADETLQHLGVIKEQVALLSRDHEMPEDLKTVLGDICTLDDEVVEAEKRHQLREKVMEKRKMLEKISGVVLQRFENAQSIKKEHSQMEARVAELTCELEQLKNRLGNVQNALEKAKKEGKEAQAEAKHLLQEITGDEALLDKPKRLLKAARVCIANILDSK